MAFEITRYVVLLILGIVAIVLYLPQFSDKIVFSHFPDFTSMIFKNATGDVDVTKTENSTIDISYSLLERQSVKFGTTENITKSWIETERIATMEANDNNPNFPTRNKSDLSLRLAGISKLMEPFISEITRVGNELKEQNLEWVLRKQTPVVVNGYEEGYFQKVNHPQIKTIIVNVKKKDIFKYLFHHTYDYTSNDCSLIEKGLAQNKLGELLYGAKCVSRDKALHPVPFPGRSFGVGMPAEFPVQQHGHVALTFIHVIRNAIVKASGDVFIGNLKIVPQRCHQYAKAKKHPKKMPENEDEEVFTIAQFWGEGFFHATSEDLPRLSPWLDFLRTNRQVKIHVLSNREFLRRMLFSLGLDPSRMVTGTRRAKVLYLPAGSSCGRSAAFNTQLLSMQFRHAMQTPPEPRKSIIVIKRSAKRWFKNHDQICQMIQKITQGTDIKLEIFSDKKLPTFEQTMAMFNRAFMVIAPHGAGLTNLLFSEEGTVNIEGLCIAGGRIVLCYRNLMRVLGHRYHGLRPYRDCRDTKPEQLEKTLRYYLNTLYLSKSSRQ